MVDTLDAGAHRGTLHDLLPQGAAWPRGEGTTLDALLLALGASYDTADGSAVGLLEDVRPDTAFDLLPDWERVLGLPDACSTEVSGIAARRASVLAKLVSQADLAIESYKEIARRYGVEIEIEEHDETRADASTTLDTTGGRWRYVWWIGIPAAADTVYFDTLSGVDRPLAHVQRNTELECRLQRAAPAHTLLVIAYKTQGFDDGFSEGFG